MKRIPAEPLNFEFSRHLEPKAHIQPGETVIVEADDALSGQIQCNSDRRDKTTVPYSNPIAGPIFVDGAEPGDALAVHIEKIHSRDGRCATYTGNPKQTRNARDGVPYRLTRVAQPVGWVAEQQEASPSGLRVV